jgi:hypothetical protein
VSATALLDAALEVTKFCAGRGWHFCFIGGVAVQRWGNPRFTADVDLTLVTGYGGEEAFIDALLVELLPRRPDARSFAITYRVLLAKTRAGIDVDVALGALPFEERSVERASPWDLGEIGAIPTCSAEDLIVHKVFAGRDRDWDDVRGVLTRRHGKLDWQIVERELPPLLELKEELDSLKRLERLAAEVERLIST